MQWEVAAAKLLDPYELKTRLLPGLLVLFPAIVYFGLIWGPKNPLLVTLMSILTVCGGPYLLSSFVRTRGQRAQDDLFAKWGGSPSTLMLRHDSSYLPEQIKWRYHELISLKLGIGMPTVAEESANPARASQAYAAAADALRPMTNDKRKYDLLFKELTSYGYNRNAHGSRYVGLIVALGTAVACLLDGSGRSTAHRIVQLSALDSRHGLVLLASTILAFLWIAHFTERTVKQSGFSYAKRLWEALEKVPKKSLGKAAVNRSP